LKLDFGFVRVNNIAEKHFVIKNSALYPVDYSFEMLEEVYLNNFKILPKEGTLDAEEE